MADPTVAARCGVACKVCVIAYSAKLSVIASSPGCPLCGSVRGFYGDAGPGAGRRHTGLGSFIRFARGDSRGIGARFARRSVETAPQRRRRINGLRSLGRTGRDLAKLASYRSI